MKFLSNQCFQLFSSSPSVDSKGVLWYVSAWRLKLISSSVPLHPFRRWTINTAASNVITSGAWITSCVMMELRCNSELFLRHVSSLGFTYFQILYFLSNYRHLVNKPGVLGEALLSLLLHIQPHHCEVKIQRANDFLIRGFLLVQGVCVAMVTVMLQFHQWML